MSPERTNAAEEGRIRKIIERWAGAIRAKDSVALASNMAHDVRLFDLINPLQYVGVASMKKRAEEWLSQFQGPIEYEVRDLHISAGDEVAFCHSLNRVNGNTKAGQKIDMWWRATVCFRKVDGDWTVTHEHSSVPFDMETGKASLGLKP